MAGALTYTLTNKICKWLLQRVVELLEMKKIECYLGQRSVLESSELKGLQKKQIKELTHISFISASKCNGEPENREILHGSEEDSGQRGTMSKILFQLNIQQADILKIIFKVAINAVPCSIYFFFTQ